MPIGLTIFEGTGYGLEVFTKRVSELHLGDLLFYVLYVFLRFRLMCFQKFVGNNSCQKIKFGDEKQNVQDFN